MANAVHCVTDNLLKNNYYYALSTASAGNPTQLPSSDTGIADSGASGFYFAPGAHVANLNSRAPPIEVEVANGLPVRSIASATLASVPSLPAATMQGHVMPSFPHTLVGLGPFADQGCQIIFTNKDVSVRNPQGVCILKGWREETGACLWRFPLKASPACGVHPVAPSTPPLPPVASLSTHVPAHPWPCLVHMRAYTHSVGDSRHMRANTHSAGDSRHMRTSTHSVGDSRHMRTNTHSAGDSRPRI